MRKKTLGIALMAIGVIMMIYTGVNYVTTKKIIDLGPIEISKEKNHPVRWSPIFGVVLLVGGVAVLITPRQKKPF